MLIGFPFFGARAESFYLLCISQVTSTKQFEVNTDNLTIAWHYDGAEKITNQVYPLRITDTAYEFSNMVRGHKRDWVIYRHGGLAINSVEYKETGYHEYQYRCEKKDQLEIPKPDF
jgi:hypothetical protein